jgi:hypothetical protein
MGIFLLGWGERDGGKGRERDERGRGRGREKNLSFFQYYHSLMCIQV